MAIAADVESILKAKFDAVLPHLDERSARLVLAQCPCFSLIVMV
jgi:hypothetical protein